MIEHRTLTWKAALKIFARFIVSFISLGYAWFCWQITSPLNWGFAIPAVLGALGGGMYLIGTIWLFGQHVYEARKWRKKAEAAPEQKGDRLAGTDRYDDLGMR